MLSEIGRGFVNIGHGLELQSPCRLLPIPVFPRKKYRLSEPKCGAGQALSRSYGRFFAEFLKDLSLVRLSLLDSTTCVGLRYGTIMLNPNEVFLGSVLLLFA